MDCLLLEHCNQTTSPYFERLPWLFWGQIRQFDENFSNSYFVPIFSLFFLCHGWILGSNNKGPAKIGSISGGNNGNLNSIQNGDHQNLSDPDNEVDDEESNHVLQQVNCTIFFLNFPALFLSFKILHKKITQSRNPLDIKKFTTVYISSKICWKSESKQSSKVQKAKESKFGLLIFVKSQSLSV